jgi:hypothetical protein
MSGLSPKSPRDYVGPNLFLGVCVTRKRRPTGADVFQPENGQLYKVSTLWQVGKNPTTGVEGEIWILTKIVANVSYWVMISGGSPPLGPILSVNVDGSSGSGTDPVLPDVSGQITVTGGQVVSGTIGANVTRQFSTAANTYATQIQQAGSAAVETTTINGVAHFNSGQFTVSNGFVSLTGGGAAIDSFTVDYAPIASYPPTAPGTVVPNASGNVDILGGNAVAIEQRDASPGNTEMLVHYLKRVTITANQTARNGFGFIANGGSRVDILLPAVASSSVGDTFEVIGRSANLWRVTQVANQIIHVGTSDSTSGAGGYIEATSNYDCIRLTCTVNDGVNSEWTVFPAEGTITVV